MLYSLPFMLVSPCVPVLILVLDRWCYGVDVRFGKNRGFLVALFLADILGLGTEGSLECGECCGGGSHELERDDDDLDGCFKSCLCLSRSDRRPSGESRMTLEAELLIKKGWVEMTEAAKSSVDIDRGGLSRNDVGFKISNVQRSIAVFDCLSVS